MLCNDLVDKDVMSEAIDLNVNECNTYIKSTCQSKSNHNVISLDMPPHANVDKISLKYLVKAPSFIPIRTYQKSDIESAEYINVGMLNFRSVNNKSMIIKYFIADNDFDIFLINESHIVPDDLFIKNYKTEIYPTQTCKDKHIIKQLVPFGYKIYHIPRIGSGGDNAIIFKKCLHCIPQRVYTGYKSFEYMEIVLKSPESMIRLILVYRPPPSSQISLLKICSFRNSPNISKDLLSQVVYH